MKINEIIKKLILESLNEERKKFNKLFHGTDIKSAMKIKKNGIDITKGDGYFGTGFYTTPDFNLAISNYANFAEYDDEEFTLEKATGVVLEFNIIDNSKILDLRDYEDFEKWKRFSNRIDNKNLYKELIKNDIDGLWDDSFEGVVIYNKDILKLIKIHKI